MAITFTCGVCQGSIVVDDAFAGKRGTCKQCGALLKIPDMPDAASEQAGQTLDDLSDIESQSGLPMNLQPCPDCRRMVSRRAVTCPHCGYPFRIPQPQVPSQQRPPSVESISDRTPHIQKESNGGRVCSILSLCFGVASFLCFGPLFGIAGFVLGIIGLSLSERKSMAVVGIILSIVGGVTGTIIMMGVLAGL